MSHSASAMGFPMSRLSKHARSFAFSLTCTENERYCCLMMHRHEVYPVKLSGNNLECHVNQPFLLFCAERQHGKRHCSVPRAPRSMLLWQL